MPEGEQRPRIHKEAQDVGQHDEVAECDSRQKKKNCGEHEAGDGATFVLVECRRHKQPYLVKNDWRSQHDSKVHAYRDDKIQPTSRVRINQLWIKMRVRERLQ